MAEASGSGAARKEYVWLDDVPVALVDDTGAAPVLYFIHTDQLGTPQKITSPGGSIVWDGTFDPFGNPQFVSGAGVWDTSTWDSATWGADLSLTNLRFPGQYADTETALNQNWFRDYDPTIGRYIQSDPVGLRGGASTYTYVDSRPLQLADPDGGFGWLVPLFTFLAYELTPQPANAPGPNDPIFPEAPLTPLTNALIGAGLARVGEAALAGEEICFGSNFRIAPFGNRTGNPLGRWPHYHRRGIDPTTGETQPGQGIGRHRPWETKSPDQGFWERF